MEKVIDLNGLKDVNRVHISVESATINVTGLNLDLEMKKPKNGADSNKKTEAESSQTPFNASDYKSDGRFHLLLAASGSVATIKIPNIIRALAKYRKLSIRIILTEPAARFLEGQSDEQPDLLTLATYSNVDGIYRNKDDWTEPWRRGYPILHVELRRWADLLVIAPLSANTLAKLQVGLCDNLLSTVVRVWEVRSLGDLSRESSSSSLSSIENDASEQKRIIVAPAMNTAMWLHPLTGQHLKVLESFHWIDILPPIVKGLACGDTGTGAMHEWTEIVKAIDKHIINSHKSSP